MTAATWWTRLVQRQRQFRWVWAYSIFCLALLALLLNLGFWQLSRAAEKDAIELRVAALASSAPINMDELAASAANNYQPVLLVGRYLDKPHWLVDNQVVNGKVGLDVVSVLLTQGGQHVLVNRGFVPGARTRSELPNFATPTGLVSVQGKISLPLGEQFMLGQQVLAKTAIQIIQNVDIPQLGQNLEQTVYPHLVRADAGYPGIFATHWQAVNMKASKHHGYALQWFSMALALVILYWMVSTRETG